MPIARHRGPYCCAAGVVSALALCARGQQEPESFTLRQRALDEEVRTAHREEPGTSAGTRLDYGGWYSFHLLIFDDGVESSRTLRRHDLRAWSRLTLDEGAHEFYFRVRESYSDFNTGDAYDGNDDDWEGPNLERGYYRFDLGRAARRYGWGDPGFDLNFKAGRDLVEFGTGLALSTPLDHVALTLSASGIHWTGLAGRTPGSSPDIDLSRRTTRTRRALFGSELRYTGVPNHEPFAYVLWQRDHNRDALPHPVQDFDYDSFYAGVGASGEAAKNVRYATEWVYESGHSFGHRRFLDNDVIRAWAWDVELEYLAPGPHQARVSVEYIFGSGDADRLGSPTDAVGGNRGDRDDAGFVGFGYRDMGLSLAPRASNLHVWRAGASFRPWPDQPRLERLELGTNGFLYHKHHRSAALSDPTADRGSGFVGWELDTFANWQLGPDVSWTVRFGAFFPGSAFSDQTTRTFLLTGVTWSF